MERVKTGKNIIAWIDNIYRISVIKRSVIILLGFQGLLWSVFGVSYITHKDAWLNVAEVESTTAAVGGWGTTFLFILFSNFIICMLIIIGNVFVKFNIVTPGLLVLVIQGITIGWLAGSNGFEIPFMNVMEANMQYLRIGLWETTAYALACAVSLPKSLHIAETFPAKKWSQTRKFKDIKLSISEMIILILSIIVLIIAALVETYAIIG